MIDSIHGQRTAPWDLPTVFVSDVHLGSKYCHAEEFLSFLENNRIGELYLVGDIIDGWRLRRKWRWPTVYHHILHRLLQMSAEGTRLYYTPGNHDEFLRNYLQDFGFVDVADEFYYESRSGTRFLITHGDKFDEVETSIPWLSMIGSSAYESLMWLNHLVNDVRGLMKLPSCRFSSRIKQSVKRAVKFISDFEHSLANYALARNCDGVICGHIHAPVMRQVGTVAYYNTGDWVEHCTALIEHHDGTWEVRDYLPGKQSVIDDWSDGEDFLQYVGRGPGPRRSGRGDHRQLAASA